MKRKAKTVIRITLIVLVALIVGMSFYSLNASRLTGNAVPMPLGFGVAVVQSGSMEPELSVGDLLIIVPRDTYETDNVVVYQEGRISIAHRIKSISEDEIITKGDANNTEDKPIQYEQIKGEVVLAIPFIGYIIQIIKMPFVALCLLIISFLLLERSFSAEKDQKREELDTIRSEIEKLKHNIKK